MNELNASSSRDSGPFHAPGYIGGEIGRSAQRDVLCHGENESTYSEHERNNAQHAHDQQHTPLVTISSANKARSARVRPRSDPTAVQDVRAEEFHREEERFLELVVDFGVAHREVEGRRVRGVLVCGSEEAANRPENEHTR
jgi:hypothetical protein